MKRPVIHRLAFAGLMTGMLVWLHAGPLPPKKSARRTSPPYTVAIAYEEHSPFVPDGRMSFADFAFSASFKDVIFVFDPSAWPPYSFKLKDGKVFLTRYEFNDVEGGCERHKPWVKEEWPKEYPARLRVAPRQFALLETGDPEVEPVVPVPPRDQVTLRFTADFGFGTSGLMWFSKLGSAVRSSMEYEFDVSWQKLLDGKPLSLRLPYDYDDTKGEWWIEFLPPKK